MAKNLYFIMVIDENKSRLTSHVMLLLHTGHTKPSETVHVQKNAGTF